MLSIEEIFHSLEGEWNIDRAVKDIGHFQGIGILTKISQNNLSYKEKGCLKTFEDSTIEGYRSFLYVLKDQTISIIFDDGPNKGLLYTSLNLDENNKGYGLHKCGQDTYKTFFHFESTNRFRIKTSILGPKKDYELNGIYNRI